MIKKIIGAIIILGGILGAVLAATADISGLNVTQDAQEVMAFGWLQITLTIVGGVIFLFGIVFMVAIAMKKPAKEEEEAPAADAAAAPAEDAAAAAPAQDLYGGQDLYASAPAAAVEQQPAQQTYEETAVAQQAQPDYQDNAVDFSAGAETPAQEGEPDNLLDDLDGLDGLEDLAEDLGDGGTAESYECPDCGAQLTSNATSCSECGAEFSEEIFECPVCGAEVPEDSSECPKCGEEFEDDEEEF